MMIWVTMGAYCVDVEAPDPDAVGRQSRALWSDSAAIDPRYTLTPTGYSFADARVQALYQQQLEASALTILRAAIGRANRID